MDLQTEPANDRNVILRLGEVNCLFAVEPNFYGRPLGKNSQFVPFALRFDPGVDFILWCLSEHLSSA